MYKKIMVLIVSCTLTFSHFCFSMERDDNNTSPNQNVIVPYSNTTTQKNISRTKQSFGTSTTSQSTASNAEANPPKKNQIVLEKESEEEGAQDQIEIVDFMNWPHASDKEQDALIKAVIDEVQNTERRIILYKEESEEEPDLSKLQLALFIRPMSMQSLHSYAKAIFVPENACAAGIGIGLSLAAILCARLTNIGAKFKLVGEIIVGCIGAAGVIIYIGNQSYKNYKKQCKKPILSHPDLKYINNIEEALNDPSIHLLTLLSKFFKGLA